MFHDIKDHLDNPAVRAIMAASAFDPSPEAMDYKAAEFRHHESWQLYGWVENGEIVGVCGFEIHKDYVEILNIAFAESIRHHGIGGKMITALWKKYEMAIEAETAAEYAALKAKLHKCFEYDRDGYTDAKTAFIRAVTEKAREI